MEDQQNGRKSLVLKRGLDQKGPPKKRKLCSSENTEERCPREDFEGGVQKSDDVEKDTSGERTSDYVVTRKRLADSEEEKEIGNVKSDDVVIVIKSADSEGTDDSGKMTSDDVVTISKSSDGERDTSGKRGFNHVVVNIRSTKITKEEESAKRTPDVAAMNFASLQDYETGDECETCMKMKLSPTSSHTSMSDPCLPKIGQSRLEIGDFLAKGVFGVVYLGRLKADAAGGESVRVAVKYLLNMNPFHVGREALMLKEIDGAGGFPRLYGVLEEESAIVMEYCQGVALKEILFRARVPVRLRALVGLCQVLEELHGAGFIHGDLHSENILIQGDGEHAKYRLIDAGLSRRLDRGDKFYDFLQGIDRTAFLTLAELLISGAHHEALGAIGSAIKEVTHAKVGFCAKVKEVTQHTLDSFL